MNPLRYSVPLFSTFAVGAFSLGGEVPRLPDAAIKLQSAYNQSIEAASKPIRERYLAEIKKLQEQSTKAGKLDDALALRREINRISIQHFTGKWNHVYGTIVISADGTAVCQNNTATLEIEGSDLVFRWKTDGIYRISLSEAGDTIQGKHINSAGKSVPITLTRIR